ncbi:FAD-dependent oxidoreductase [Niveispirillum sp. BGYR6]|uniref:flavin monoamine oxidase family protein n=1 Tax=Niveispirillum sp. BGYR6 TaxID=2971249 RepID=UPI0022B9406F|nr:FAD-dependent oxidoreductase [Niveispirillum sp. BGYR6]MDG5497548.1 FAD-dependent oxidoreductase [Niveispirillum sp. BGYR6]
MTMKLTRRDLLRRAAVTGGYGATYMLMQGLGIMAAPAAYAGPPDLPAGLGGGRHVAVLGAGVAGLVAAHELEKAGFRVTLLEARQRLGGRTWTIRDGDRIEHLGHESQVARLSPGIGFNAGPARIPSHHEALLSYIRALKVPLEVEVNSSRSAWHLSPTVNGGQPVRQRQLVNDTRGWLSELLGKATKRGALDGELTAEDKERLLAFLRAYGDLDADGAFKGTERSGYLRTPGAADQTGQAVAPLPLRDLFSPDTLPSLLFEDNILMQATMFQPTGGMDRITEALGASLRPGTIRRGAVVTSIRRAGDGVAITWRDNGTGKEQRLLVDQAIVTLPLPILARTDNDFPAPVKAAIAAATYDHANKVAFEAPRFWEAEQIYGGISFTGGENSLIWYPSDHFNAPTGLLVGAYNVGANAAAFQALPLAEQVARTRAAVARVHPGSAPHLQRGLAINWRLIPFNEGPWLHWEVDGNDPAAYALLNQPIGPIHLAGAHLSQLPSWQEGAVLSAQRAVTAIAHRTAAGGADIKTSLKG